MINGICGHGNLVTGGHHCQKCETISLPGGECVPQETVEMLMPQDMIAWLETGFPAGKDRAMADAIRDFIVAHSTATPDRQKRAEELAYQSFTERERAEMELGDYPSSPTSTKKQWLAMGGSPKEITRIAEALAEQSAAGQLGTAPTDEAYAFLVELIADASEAIEYAKDVDGAEQLLGFWKNRLKLLQNIQDKLPQPATTADEDVG